MPICSSVTIGVFTAGAANDEGAPAGPAAQPLRGAFVQLTFHAHQHVCQVAGGLCPSGNNILGRRGPEHLLDDIKQVLADDRIVLRQHAEARMLVGDVFQYCRQARGVLDILRVDIDGTRQRLLLLPCS
jgi:hypothetical protein